MLNRMGQFTVFGRRIRVFFHEQTEERQINLKSMKVIYEQDESANTAVGKRAS